MTTQLLKLRQFTDVTMKILAAGIRTGLFSSNTYLYTIFVVFELKITKGCIFVFDIGLYFFNVCKYNQSHKNYNFTNKM